MSLKSHSPKIVVLINLQHPYRFYPARDREPISTYLSRTSRERTNRWCGQFIGISSSSIGLGRALVGKIGLQFIMNFGGYFRLTSFSLVGDPQKKTNRIRTDVRSTTTCPIYKNHVCLHHCRSYLNSSFCHGNYVTYNNLQLNHTLRRKQVPSPRRWEACWSF